MRSDRGRSDGGCSNADPPGETAATRVSSHDSGERAQPGGVTEDVQTEHSILLDATDDRWAWRRRIRQNPRKHFFYRMGVGIVGGFFILVGLLTGPLPGPGGIPLVLLGLAIWSSEFEWAQKLMQWFKAQLKRVQRWPRWARVGLVIIILGCIAISSYVAMRLQGVPGFLPDPVRDALLSLPGL